MQILVGADLVPTQTNIELFNSGNYTELLGDELCQVLHSADYRIFNLEVPLTDTLSPIDKNGPALIAPTSTVVGYKAMGVDCLTIANNHIMDQGAEGLFSTLKVLDENNISYVGGGKSIEEAQKPFVVEKEGKKIGIYACAEHEFSIADATTPGANPFDALESLDHVAALKSECDYVIVLYHGGKEHYRYPSPNLQKVCRKLVDKGADLVVCQHSHCIGCEEKYKDGTIVYGQGNFLFDHSQSEFWQTSLLIKIDNDFSISYIPLIKKENQVRLAEGDQAEAIFEGFNARSEEIKHPDAINLRYADFAESMRDNYLVALGTINVHNFFFKVINKISGYRFATWIINRKYNKAKLLRIQNCIECEAHRELMLLSVKNSK